MNLLADEGVDGQIVAALRRDGHEIWLVQAVEKFVNQVTSSMAHQSQGGRL